MLQSLQILRFWQCLPGKLYNLEIATALFWEGMFHHSWIPSFLQKWVQPTELLHDLPCIQILRQKYARSKFVFVNIAWWKQQKHSKPYENISLSYYSYYINIQYIHISWKKVLRRSIVKTTNQVFIVLYLSPITSIFQHRSVFVLKAWNPEWLPQLAKCRWRKRCSPSGNPPEKWRSTRSSILFWLVVSRFQPIWKISVKMGIFPK